MFRYHDINTDVIRTGRNARHFLAGECKTDNADSVYPCKKTVIVTGPVSEPVPGPVKTDHRHNHGSEVSCTGWYLVANRFRDMERALHEDRWLGEIGEPERVGLPLDNWNDDTRTPVDKGIDEVAG